MATWNGSLSMFLQALMPARSAVLKLRCTSSEEAHAMRGDGASDFVDEQIWSWATHIIGGGNLNPATPNLDAVLSALRKS
jgi:hypothetical protein